MVKGEKVPDAVLGEIARRLVAGESLHEAAIAVGVSTRTASRRRAEIEMIEGALKRAEVRAEVSGVATDLVVASQRTLLARTIAEDGPFSDVGALIDAFGKRTTDDRRPVFDNVVKALWSLQKQGEITFSQSSNSTPSRGHHGPASGSLTRIRALPSLYRRLGIAETSRDWPPTVPGPQPVHKVGKDYTDANRHGSVAVGGPIERRVVDRPIPEPGLVTPDDSTTVHPVGVDPTDHHTQPDETYEVPEFDLDPGEPVPEPWTTPGPEEPEFPILAAIRGRVEAQRKAKEAADLILRAAELLSADKAETLLTEASRLVDETALTDVEAEYLRFAEERGA